MKQLYCRMTSNEADCMTCKQLTHVASIAAKRNKQVLFRMSQVAGFYEFFGGRDTRQHYKRIDHISKSLFELENSNILCTLPKMFHI